MGGDVSMHLEPVISAYNNTDHNALHNTALTEVVGNDDSRFRLHNANADKQLNNIN